MLRGYALTQLMGVLGESWEGSECFERACIDSRHVHPGDLFFAIKGEKADGHQFLQEVFTQGAAAAVVSSQHYRGEDFGGRVVVVPDVIEAMQKLASWGLAQKKITVIGITGSIGKTTTKEFLFQLLESRYPVAKTPGNANSQIGLPLGLMNTPIPEGFLIVEMGMSRRGEIAKLVQIAPPDVALITKIGHSHIDAFEDGLEGIAAAKGEILSHPKTRLVVMNRSCEQFKVFAEREGLQKVFFGLGDEMPDVELPFRATHLVENFLGAAAMAHELGMSWDEIKAQAKKLHPFKLRFERVERNGIVFINDSYNASPESMLAALGNLPAASGKTIAVLGGMGGLGKLSEKCHREVALAALKTVDHLLCYGELCAPMVEVFMQAKRPVEFFVDFDALKTRLFGCVAAGDVVLIKGSNFNQLWKLLEE